MEKKGSEKKTKKKKAEKKEEKKKIVRIAKPSVKPPTKGVPSWVEFKPKEVEEAIISLVNAGHSQSEIGVILRDQHGIPSVKTLLGKSVGEVLQENSLLGEIPEDLMNLIKKSVKLREHLEKNRKDFTAKRGYQLTVAKIRRLVKYYRKKERLPKGWRYTPETAALLVK